MGTRSLHLSSGPHWAETGRCQEKLLGWDLPSQTQNEADLYTWTPGTGCPDTCTDINFRKPQKMHSLYLQKNSSLEVCTAPFPDLSLPALVVQGEKETYHTGKGPCCFPALGSGSALGSPHCSEEWGWGEEVPFPTLESQVLPRPWAWPL